jgi:excisionase family DNA binding protein
MHSLSEDFTELLNRVAAMIASRVRERIEIQSVRGRIAPRLLTVKEAAAYIGRTEQAVQHLIHRRELIVVRRGRRVHLDRSDLDRWIDGNKI